MTGIYMLDTLLNIKNEWVLLFDTSKIYFMLTLKYFIA